MIRYYYKNLRAKKVGELETYHPGSWVYVESPTVEEVDFLVKQFKLDIGHIEDALDPDEMPRLEKQGDLTYIFIRYAFSDEGTELGTVPLLLIVGQDLLITISRRELPHLDRFVGGKIQFATTQRTKLVLLILDEAFDQYENFINRSGRQIKVIRSHLRGHGISNRDFVDFVLIEDELNEFMSAMLPTSAILRRLLLGRHIQLFEQDQDIMEDLLLNNEQSIEGCRSHVKSIVNIREAYATISSNNLNHSMKLLTAATVLITLPNVVFGMYGMNIDLPFQNEPWIFAALVTVCLAIALAVFLFARSRRVF